MRPGTVLILIAAAPFAVVVGVLAVMLATGLLIAAAGPPHPRVATVTRPSPSNEHGR